MRDGNGERTVMDGKDGEDDGWLFWGTMGSSRTIVGRWRRDGNGNVIELFNIVLTCHEKWLKFSCDKILI